MGSRRLVLGVIAVLSLTLPPPASARGGGGASLGGGLHGSGGFGFHHGGGFHQRGGFRHGGFRGFHRRQGFRRFGCCFSPVLGGGAFAGGGFLDAADAATYYDYSYPVYPPPPAD